MGMILISWGLWFGAVPQQETFINTPEQELFSTHISTVAGLSLAGQYKCLTLFTSMESFQNIKSAIVFNPYQINYTIGANFDVTKNIRLTVSHECDHPVIYNFDEQKTLVSMNMTKAYILIHSKE